MPDAPHLPSRPSLEQLRKIAKERLKSERDAGTTSLTLADVQRSVARDHGFANWADLVAHVEAANPPGLQRLQRMADDLAAAYTAADVDAIRSFNWTHGTSFYWYREPEQMHQQLPTWWASTSRDPALAVADARELLARSRGEESWDALVRGMAATLRPHDRAALPAFLKIDPDLGMLVDGVAADAHWDSVLSVIAERGIEAVLARGLTDRGLKALSRSRHVTRLAISGTQVTDAGLRHLAHMPQLQSLALGGPRSQVSDAGLESLRALTSLRRLTIPWTPGVSDTGIAHLAGCERLELVDLMGTFTGDGAVRALSGKPRLAHLSTGRLVTDDGLRVLADFPVFREPLGAEPTLGLMDFAAERNHLLLDGPFTDAGLRMLAGLQGIAGVNLFWHTPSFTAAGLAACAEIPNLVFLGCDGKRCDDEAMRAIATLPKLRMLMGQGSVASDAGFSALSRSPTLEYFWGRECPGLSNAGFAALAGLPSLKGLAVSCARVDVAELARLAQIPTLTSLVTMGITDAGFKHVGRCEQLQQVWCMYCRDTTDASTDCLQQLRHLKTYYAGETRITDRSLETLAGMSSLERIELSAIAAITDAGVGGLSRLPRLRALEVAGSPLVTPAVRTRFAPHVRVLCRP